MVSLVTAMVDEGYNAIMGLRGSRRVLKNQKDLRDDPSKVGFSNYKYLCPSKLDGHLSLDQNLPRVRNLTAIGTR